MSEGNKNGKAFLRGAAIIAGAHLFIKLLGALYKIPLDRMILGTKGMGIYNAAYYIYNWLFVVSTAGLPVAISKMVSAADVLGKHRETERILSVATRFMFFVGLAGAALLFFGAELFAGLLNADAEGMSVSIAIRALSPSIFFVALMAAYRGYTQGCGAMVPTAVSEIAESVGKLGIGLVLAAWLVQGSLANGAAGAIGGVSCGAALGFFSILFISRKNRKRNKALAAKDENVPRARRVIFKELFKTAIPITLGASVFTLTSLIDTAMIFHLLESIGYGEELYYSLSGYLGRAVTMFNLPPTLIAALAVSLVPALSSALALGDRKTAAATATGALRITVLISLPCAIGLSVLAAPILSFVYNDASYAFLLTVMGIAVAFVTMVQVSNAVLQAYGYVWKPVIFMACGALVKILVNYVLVRQPHINIYGAPMGTLLCYAVVMVLNLIAIRRTAQVRYAVSAFLVKPLFSGAVMGACAYGAHWLLAKVLPGSAALLCAIGVGVAVYFAMMLLLRGILKEDVLLLPKGDKIFGWLIKLHWMEEK